MFKEFNDVVKKIYTIDSKFLTVDSNGLSEPLEPVPQPSLLQDFSDFYSNYISPNSPYNETIVTE